MENKKKIIIISIVCIIGFFTILTFTQWNKTFSRSYIYSTKVSDEYAVGKKVVYEVDGERIVFHKNGHFTYGRVEKSIMTEVYYKGKYYYDNQNKQIHITIKKDGEKWERVINWSKPESIEYFDYQTYSGGIGHFQLEGF